MHGTKRVWQEVAEEETPSQPPANETHELMASEEPMKQIILAAAGQIDADTNTYQRLAAELQV
jgi:hypothetical protein